MKSARLSEYEYKVAQPNRFSVGAKVELLLKALESRALQITERTRAFFYIGDPRKIDMSSEAITMRFKLVSHLCRLQLSLGKAKLRKGQQK